MTQIRLLTSDEDFLPVKPHDCVRVVIGEDQDMTQVVRPVVCVKSAEVDRYISSSILLSSKVWEQDIITTVLWAVSQYPSASFFDIGSNLGLYSLSVASLFRKMGNTQTGKVLAVDAMADNLAFIRASLLAEQVSSSQITFINNPVSNTTSPLYPVHIGDDWATNPGSIMFLPEEQMTSAPLGPPVTAITLPKILSLASSTNIVIIKMDIQGHECRVLHSDEVFSSHQFMPYIFMEWAEVILQQASCPNLAKFIDHLHFHGYTPRWPVSMAVVPRKCLGLPVMDILWVHRDANVMGDGSTTYEECNKTGFMPQRDPGLGGWDTEGLLLGKINIIVGSSSREHCFGCTSV